MVILGGIEYMTRKEVCDFLHISRQTMVNWMNEGRPPKVYRLGGRVYYRKDEVESLMEDVSKSV